jgi:hypothetical protein
LPKQIHGRVAIIEGDLQGPGVSTGESYGDGFREVDGLVGGLSSQTDHMSARCHADSLGVGAMDAIENDQALSNTSVERLGERQLVINP